MMFDFASVTGQCVLTTIFLVIVTVCYWYGTIPKNIPKGPLGLPIAGYMPFLKKPMHISLNKLAKKYGPVFRLYLGSRLVIVLNDYNTIKEALVKQSSIFGSRPLTVTVFDDSHGRRPKIAKDIVDRTHRRFNLKLLKEFGVGKTSIEPRLMDEIQHFMKELQKHANEPYDFKYIIEISVANNICNLLFGHRYEYNDEKFLNLIHHLDEFVKYLAGLSVRFFFPWARHLPFMDKLMGQKRVRELQNVFERFINDEWKTHQEEHYEGRKDDYASAYISEQKERFRKDTKDDIFSDFMFLENGMGLQGAGSETTASLLKWCIIYLLHYPDVQKKIQKEIDEVIGMEKIPEWNDRLRTPFMEATIMEIQRIVSLAPLGVPLTNTEETVLNGYRIPKRSYIIVNLWNVHHDPKLWDNPDTFQPERFLNDRNELIEKPDYLIPFGVGKRSCIGENLARMESYLYLASMLQKFNFESDKNGHLPSFEGNIGLVIAPKPYKVVLRRR